MRIDFRLTGHEKGISITCIAGESYRDAVSKAISYVKLFDPTLTEADLVPTYIWKGETSVDISLIEVGYWFLSFTQPGKTLPTERLHCDAVAIGDKAIGYLDHFNATAGMFC